MPSKKPTENQKITKRQLAVMAVFLLLFTLVCTVLYWKDRQREWLLREEQATHRLGLAYELITRELERVTADILFLSNQDNVRNHQAENDETRSRVEAEFARFLQVKGTYQQLRLLDMQGRESVRVDQRKKKIHVVPESDLQDKQDRYYVRESFGLANGELFVSEFDLNQEHGVIEDPLNPVIRFVTPVADYTDKIQYLLVANFRGAPLLKDLATIELPGHTLLIRNDGQFLLGRTSEDPWGWLLHHQNTFDTRFTEAWNQRNEATDKCLLTASGAFQFRKIQLGGFAQAENDKNRPGKNLLLVSFLPRTQVFETSRQLLNRLLILVVAVSIPLLVLTRFWAVASLRRQQQNEQILESEKQLRELSSRLVMIQEEERKAISREIHDQLGQQVTAINLDLKLAERETDSPSLRDQLRRAIDESEHLLQTLHDFATRIRPDVLDDLGLHDAVESHLWEFRDRTGIETDFTSNIDGVSLPTVLTENVYRLIQESLNNVLKHANATRVNVAIQRSNQNGQDELIVRVQDDGVGTATTEDRSASDSDGKKSKLGIIGMRERVNLLGGTLQFQSKLDQGTSIDAVVPINASTTEPLEKESI